MTFSITIWKRTFTHWLDHFQHFWSWTIWFNFYISEVKLFIFVNISIQLEAFSRRMNFHGWLARWETTHRITWRMRNTKLWNFHVYSETFPKELLSYTYPEPFDILIENTYKSSSESKLLLFNLINVLTFWLYLNNRGKYITQQLLNKEWWLEKTILPLFSVFDIVKFVNI